MIKKVLVFTPTYNEIDNIENWLFEVMSQDYARVLVIDDSSQDGTTNLLISKARQLPNLQVIVRSTKSGIGSAHKVALNEASEKGFDLLVTLDADLSHNPRDIQRFIQASKKSNYVVGTRTHGGVNQMSGLRLILSKGANLTCRMLLPTGLSEYTTSFRCYDKCAIKALISNMPKGEGYSFFIEATEVLYRSRLKLEEIPIVFKDRAKGHSKIPPLQVIKSFMVITRLLITRITWLISGGKPFFK